MEINACAQLRYKAQDRLLSEAYQAVIKGARNTDEDGRAAGSARQVLIKSQRQWVLFRDADCKAASG